MPAVSRKNHASSHASPKAKVKHIESPPTLEEKTNEERPPIVPRSYRFHLPADRALDWDENGKHSACFFNTMSIFFPLGEQFFINSVKKHSYAVPKGSKLYDEVRSFVQQESTHSREHELYNDVMRPHAPVALMEYVIEMVLYTVSLLPRSLNLGGTIALEHLTACLGHSFLATISQHENSEEHFKALWRWHAHEEIEHKAVAYDVYVAAYGYGPFAYAMRMFTYGLALVIFTALLVPFFLIVIIRAGILFDMKGWKHMIHFHWNKENGALRCIAPHLVDYLKPGFHPWQLDDSNLLKPLSEPPTKRSK